VFSDPSILHGTWGFDVYAEAPHLSSKGETAEKMLLRLSNSSAVKSVHELGLPQSARVQMETFLRQTTGLTLVTGPAGSGKTIAILRLNASHAKS
jgi:type II secretory ATPase GspE/PulE/Tfp pilus assembly ATPase PilB-like protein